jgi:hypothetical protein
VPDRVRKLRPPRRLEVGQQVELAAIVGPMVQATQRDAARRVSALAKGARDQVRRVDPPVPQTMHLRPATAARWPSVAVIDVLRASGVDLRNLLLARRGSAGAGLCASSVLLSRLVGSPASDHSELSSRKRAVDYERGSGG